MTDLLSWGTISFWKIKKRKHGEVRKSRKNIQFCHRLWLIVKKIRIDGSERFAIIASRAKWVSRALPKWSEYGVSCCRSAAVDHITVRLYHKLMACFCIKTVRWERQSLSYFLKISTHDILGFRINCDYNFCKYFKAAARNCFFGVDNLPLQTPPFDLSTFSAWKWYGRTWQLQSRVCVLLLVSRLWRGANQAEARVSDIPALSYPTTLFGNGQRLLENTSAPGKCPATIYSRFKPANLLK